MCSLNGNRRRWLDQFSASSAWKICSTNWRAEFSVKKRPNAKIVPKTRSSLCNPLFFRDLNRNHIIVPSRSGTRHVLLSNESVHSSNGNNRVVNLDRLLILQRGFVVMVPHGWQQDNALHWLMSIFLSKQRSIHMSGMMHSECVLRWKIFVQLCDALPADSSRTTMFRRRRWAAGFALTLHCETHLVGHHSDPCCDAPTSTMVTRLTSLTSSEPARRCPRLAVCVAVISDVLSKHLLHRRMRKQLQLWHRHDLLGQSWVKKAIECSS